VDAGYPLSQFVTFCADHYLSSEHREVRLEAVKTCSHLLTPSLTVSICDDVFIQSVCYSLDFVGVLNFPICLTRISCFYGIGTEALCTED